MTTRLVDLDDGKLDAGRCLHGTPTLEATVAGALDEVLSLDRRRRALLTDGAQHPKRWLTPAAAAQRRAEGPLPG